ncbi:MAG TPA: glycosyltransferase family 4 protein [Thermomicrobiales bacterium]|nr:glycosyltransferase family 4 protein [Thermomicrobiales bacterium]
MKIALVSPYSMQQPGGVAEHVAHLRDEFQRIGHDVTVMAPRGDVGGLERSDGSYGIGRTITIPGNGSKMRLTFDVTLYADVKAIMRRERFDIVHLHEPLMPVLPYMVLLNSRAVNVATFHAYSGSQPWYSALKPYMSFVLTRLDGRIAVSRPARDFVSKYFEGDYDIIPNGIDVDRYGKHVEPFPWAFDGTPRILFVGRFEESRKGFRYLIRAMPLVRQQYPNAKLIVIGSGRPEKFTNLMERYGVDNVEFQGFVSQEDKARYYASADVCCVPSTGNESFGYVIVEPMAAGRPVVATNIPGYASVATSGKDAVLVEPRDPQALALGIVRVLADRELRAQLCEAGPASAQQYDWPQVAQRVIGAYRKAAASAVHAPWRQRSQ